MVAGHGVDRLRVAGVGAEEPVAVGVDAAGGVDDVAADEQELGARGRVQQRRDDRVLRGVALAGVAHHDERDPLLLGVVDDEVGAAVGSSAPDPCASPSAAIQARRRSFVGSPSQRASRSLRDSQIGARPSHENALSRFVSSFV